MKKNKLPILIFLFVLIIFIIACIAPSSVESKGYTLTPSEYTITSVTTYTNNLYINKFEHTRYQINISHEKDGKVYKSHCYTNIDEDEYNIIKKYFDAGNEEAAKNYIGNIKAYKNSDFKILNTEIND